MDSLNTKVGDVIDLGLDGGDSQDVTGTLTRITLGGTVFVVRATRSALRPLVDRLRFETDDCTGPPVFVDPAHPSSLIAGTAIGAPGQTVYTRGMPAQVFTERSSYSFTNAACEVPQPNQRSGVPAIPLADLSTLFTPPFEVR